MAKVTKEILIEADKKGLSDTQIAEECGVSRQAVFHMRKKFGILKGEKKKNTK